MPKLTLTKTGLKDGYWDGALSGHEGESAPDLRVTLDETEVPDVTVSQMPGDASQWQIRVPIPADRISDGIQTFLIRDAQSGEVLNSFALMSGEALSYDIRSEIGLLRAELDMLKSVIRRHMSNQS